MCFSSVFLATNEINVYRLIGCDRHYVTFLSQTIRFLIQSFFSSIDCTDHTIYTQCSLLFFLIFFANRSRRHKTQKLNKNTLPCRFSFNRWKETRIKSERHTRNKLNKKSHHGLLKWESVIYISTNKKIYTSDHPALISTQRIQVITFSWETETLPLKDIFRGYAPVSKPCVIWGITKIYINSQILRKYWARFAYVN